MLLMIAPVLLVFLRAGDVAIEGAYAEGGIAARVAKDSVKAAGDDDDDAPDPDRPRGGAANAPNAAGDQGGDGGAVATGQQKQRDKITKGWSLAPQLGFALLRRLDDASFWVIIATVVTSTHLLRVADARFPSDGVPRAGWGGWRVLLALLTAFVLWTYVDRACRTHATLFWWKESALFNETKTTRYSVPWVTVALIQFAEGLLNLFALAAVCYGVHASSRVATRIRANVMAARASDLLTACTSPFTLALIGIAIFKTLASDAGFVDEPSLWYGSNVMGQLFVASLPLIALVIYCLWQWRHTFRYRVTLGTEAVSVQAYLPGIEAEPERSAGDVAFPERVDPTPGASPGSTAQPLPATRGSPAPPGGYTRPDAPPSPDVRQA
jgi:hypothetical protein